MDIKSKIISAAKSLLFKHHPDPRCWNRAWIWRSPIFPHDAQDGDDGSCFKPFWCITACHGITTKHQRSAKFHHFFSPKNGIVIKNMKSHRKI